MQNTSDFEERPRQTSDSSDDEEETNPGEEQMLARMTLNDVNISPKPFSGTSSDTEKADHLVSCFQNIR